MGYLVTAKKKKKYYSGLNYNDKECGDKLRVIKEG